MLLGLIPCFVIGQPYWVQRMNFGGQGRIETVGLSMGSKGYISTGTNGTPFSFFKDLQEYDPASNTWSNKADLPIPIRGATGFTTDSSLFITTGSSPYGFVTDLYEWNRSTNAWGMKSPLPSGEERSAAVGFSINQKGYIATGHDPTFSPLNDIWEYDPVSDAWTARSPLPGGGRSYAACFVLGNKAYIATGDNGSTYTNDLWEYNPQTNLWSQKASLPGTGRAGAVGFTSGGKGYVMGGIDNNLNSLNDVWEYNPVSDSWRQMPSFPAFARAYSAGFSIYESGFIAAGSTITGNSTEVWEYTPFPVSIHEQKTISYRLFPVPCNDHLNLDMNFPAMVDLTIVIRDVTGRILFQKLFSKTAEELNATIGLSEFRSGIYALSVSDENGQVLIKETFIKQ